MIDTATLLWFMGTSSLLILAPGPDIVFVFTQGLANGRKAGFETAIGLALGNVVHTLLAAFGIALLIQSSPATFAIVKIFGACYLAYLSYMAFSHRHDSIEQKANGSAKKQKLLLKGFIMNVLNPKVAIFFMAYFPKFADITQGNTATQFLILGAVFILLVAIIFGLIGLFAGMAQKLFSNNPKFSAMMNVLSSIVFAIIAITLLLT